MEKLKTLLFSFLLLFCFTASEAIGPDSTVISTFQMGSALKASIDYYDTWSYNRSTDWVTSDGDLADYMMVSCRGNFNIDWTYGENAPDGTPAAKLTTGLTTWGGWTQALIDFSSNADSISITSEPLPVNITSALKSGEKVVAMDVYYEDLDSEHPFDDIASYRAANKLKEGIKIQIRMQNAEAYSSINEGPSFLTKEAYITEAGKWQTLYFIFDDENDFTPDEFYADGDNIDRFMVILNYQYNSAVSSNYWIKDLRVVNSPAMGEVIADLKSPALMSARIDYYDTWSYNKAYHWVDANDDYSPYVMVSCRGGFNSNWEYGVNAPDGQAASKFTSNLTTWGGWTLGLFDFVKALDSVNVVSDTLPATEMKKLKSGEKMLALDVYFEDMDEEHPFDSIAAFRSGAKNKYGIKFQVRLQNAEEYATLGNDAANHGYIVKEAYIDKPNTWQTLFFYADDEAEIAANPTWNDSSKINRILFGINYGYDAAIESNYYVKNLRIVDGSLVSDTDPPSIPDAVVDAKRFSANLSWEPSTDETGVSVYNLYNDNWSLMQSVFTESITLEQLTPETDYTFYLTAMDGFGNESEADTIEFTTLPPDTEAPTTPPDLQGTPGPTSIVLEWNKSTDNDTVVGYKIYSGDVVLDTTELLNFTVSGLESETEYILGVSAIDLAGNESGKAVITISTIKGAFDIEIDAVLDEDWNNFELWKVEKLLDGWEAPESEADCSGEFRLAWSPDGLYMFIEVFDNVRNVDESYAGHNKDHVEVNIDPYNNKTKGAYTGGQMQFSFTPDPALSPGVWLNGADNTTGIDVTRLVYSFLEKNNSYIFEVFYPWNALGRSTVPQPEDMFGFDVTIADADDDVRETVLGFYVSTGIYNTWNDPSIWSSLIFKEGGSFEMLVDTIPPTMVETVVADLQGNDVTVSWTPSTDNMGIAQYDILDEYGEVIHSVAGTDTSYTFFDLTPGTYYYTVIAKDAAGNASLINMDQVHGVIITSINSASIEKMLNVYPNPATDKLYISGCANINEIQVFDVLGQKVMNINVTNDKVELNTSGLNNGFYLIRFTDNSNNSYIRKVIKN
jgi:hypothetical protein